MDAHVAYDRFVNPSFRFEIDYPMDWSVNSNSETGRVVFMEPERKRSGFTNVLVYPEKRETLLETEGLLDARRKELEAGAEDCDLLNERIGRHPCGAVAAWHIYREIQDSVKLVGHECIINVPGERRVYMLIGHVVEERFPYWQPVFEHIFESFSLSRASGKWFVKLPENLPNK